MDGPTILVVDDEPTVTEVVSVYLKRAGYQVMVAGDGQTALEALERELPALVVLDLTLPEVDGLEITRWLRARGDTPIIMLTARGGEADRILGLELGADDYVVKPFSPRLLVARVKAVLRRGPLKEERGAGDRVSLPGFSIDVARHEVKVDGKPITLTATEMRLLHLLASHPGRVFTRDHLLSRVIGEHAVEDWIELVRAEHPEQEIRRYAGG